MEQILSLMRAPAKETTPDTLIEIAVLVQRTISGDSAAFETIILRFERRVLALSIRLLNSPEDAQDAAQEVFLRAFKYIHRLDLSRPVEPWLVRMTVNVCRDIGRKRQQRRNTFQEDTVADIASKDESTNPHNGFAGEQRKQFLWKALDNLPEKERMAVILRDIEGFSTSEVATILRSSETTVRSQVSRARMKMKEAIGLMTGGRP